MPLLVYNKLMKINNSIKAVSLTLVLTIAASVSSCTASQRSYDVIKESDTWYECSSFEVSDLYPTEEYEYYYFETVGADDGAVYIMVEAVKKSEGNYSELTDEQYLELYEQSILKLSFDGELLDKMEFDPIAGEGLYRAVQKAWISDGRLSILEQEFNADDSSISYYFNGQKIILPDVSNYYNNPVYIEDMYISNGYSLFKLYINSWADTYVLIRPDGSYMTIYLDGYINGGVDASGDFIPSDDGKAILPVYLSTGENIYISIDPVTAKIEELQGLYGSSDYMLENVSGKMVVRDFTSLSLLDKSSGNLEKICDYIDIDGLLCEVMESQTLYISDDSSEMIFGYESYDEFSGSSGYKIMHLSRAASNPNAGKTELIISTNKEFYPERSDFIALQQFNNTNDSFFIKYVLPVEENGEYKEVDADILLAYNPSAEASDKNKFIDLTQYVDINGSSFREDYFTNAIEAVKTGDAIYRMPLDISASGIITASSNVPDGQKGFTFDQYVVFVDEVCNGVDPMSRTRGYKMGKAEYFTKLFMNMSDLYIYDGKVHLDGDNIRELMQFVDEHGNEIPMTDEEITHSLIEEHNAEISQTYAEIEGRYGAVYGELDSFRDYISCYNRYGEAMGIYGLPSFDGRGPMTISHEFVSIYSTTKYPEACTEFVKFLLSYDIQKTMDENPVNRAALRTIAEEKLKAYNAEVEFENSFGFGTNKLISEEAIDDYINILTSSYSVMNVGGAIEDIIREESSSYFAGGRAMDDVIPVMQKRIQTVLDETA